MASGAQKNRLLIREAAPELDRLKYEIAAELGVNAPQDGYWGDLPSRQCGAVGGGIVRRLIQEAERSLAGRSMGSFQR